MQGSPFQNISRWFWRVCLRHSFAKGIVIGFIFVYVIYLQNTIETLDHPLKRKFTEIPTTLKYASSHKASELIRNLSLLIHQYKVAFNASQSPSKPSRINLSSGKENHWREVFGSKKKIYVYSAYYDNRKSKKLVRIIAIVRKPTKATECNIYLSNGTSLTVKGSTKTIREGWSLPYIACFINCEVPSNLNDTIQRVAVHLKNAEVILPKIKVVQMHLRKNEGFMSVCVKSFHYQYNRAVWLVEFIEMHLLLGVDRFIFYNHTVGPDVEEVLKHYILNGIVEIHQWDLPVKSQKEIRTEGLFAALNDCNMKSAYRFDYSMMIDLDEYIIPRNFTNYRGMIKALGDHSAYIFQNVFFYLYWPNDTLASEYLYKKNDSAGVQLYGLEAEGPYMLTAYKTTRLKTPHKHGKRSKYIVKPHKAIECGNHRIWEFTDGKAAKNVPTKVALVHHYRICEFGGFDCLKLPKMIDRAAHAWMEPLIERIGGVCSDIFPDTGSCPPAPPLGSPW